MIGAITVLASRPLHAVLGSFNFFDAIIYPHWDDHILGNYFPTEHFEP